MESTSRPHDPDDPVRPWLQQTVRATASRLICGCRAVPRGVGRRDGYPGRDRRLGIAAQSGTGLAVALAGVIVFLGVAALALHRFREVDGVRVDG